ncbi:hypothetical protein RRG08_036276 [Elysia crispata]|uniref:Uncharacterized protein n=1 Tax=Elysia crispata TaxID=231223 RepID=A0AAE0ZT90_9GAST|nr:hypothetical protein RRG08_036276 [Elysia crispata]
MPILLGDRGLESETRAKGKVTPEHLIHPNRTQQELSCLLDSRGGPGVHTRTHAHLRSRLTLVPLLVLRHLIPGLLTVTSLESVFSRGKGECNKVRGWIGVWGGVGGVDKLLRWMRRKCHNTWASGAGTQSQSSKQSSIVIHDRRGFGCLNFWRRRNV